MFLNWYKNVINNFKSYGDKIEQVETSVVGKRQKFKEIFERNLVLEKEISERTEELNKANKGLLTLKHIWGTLNSAEPLSEVLSIIAEDLSNDLGYLCCFIFQLHETEHGNVLRVRAAAENPISTKIQSLLGESLYNYEISMNKTENVMVSAINENSLKSTRNICHVICDAEPKIEDETIEKLTGFLGNRSISILPIGAHGMAFGCLVAVSVRSEISDTEKNFLSLLAGQIELAITITGLFEQVREQAITDGLTGLYNRRHFENKLTAEAERAVRLKQPFSLVTLDLDHLKTINDTYGHHVGDLAICHIGKVLKQNARSIDIPARFGGEEFAVILPGIDVEGALIAAERMRAAIAATPIESAGTVTASIGVATFLTQTQSLDVLLDMADTAMYKAKKSGRNQVKLAVL